MEAVAYTGTVAWDTKQEFHTAMQCACTGFLACGWGRAFSSPRQRPSLIHTMDQSVVAVKSLHDSHSQAGHALLGRFRCTWSAGGGMDALVGRAAGAWESHRGMMGDCSWPPRDTVQCAWTEWLPKAKACSTIDPSQYMAAHIDH